MNILIVSTNRAVSPMPVMPIGACIVAEAAERAGHAVTLADLMFAADPVRALETALGREKYDLIGLSVRNIDNNDMYGTVFYIDELAPLVDAVRRHTNAPIVLGGASLTVMPEEILRAVGADYAVIGDGEATFPRLLERMSRHEAWEDLPGIAFLRDGVFKINLSSPASSLECAAPAYHRWTDQRAYRVHLSTVPVQTKIGCQFQCVYCTYRKIEGSAYRLSAPECVADAVSRLAATGSRDIEFVDSVFNAPYEHAMALCEALARKKHGARLQSLELNPRFFNDGLVTAMERAGFTGMGITVDSASDTVLQGLRKGFTIREVHHAADVVRRHGLPCAWIFLLGGPGETRETVKETLRFAETAISPQDVAFFNIGIRIYPGTGIESIARQQGLLTLLAGEMLAPVFYVSPEVDAAWIRGQVKHSMSSRMNFMSVDSFSFPYLPLIHRTGFRLGLRPPLWRYTRFIRRGLRFAGMDV
jgi:radical SAM superfamily enzyme YgiQ (UPF0313 family)